MEQVDQPATYDKARTLYVGDLPEWVNEQQLFEKFGTIGTVRDVKVIRDHITKVSLRYAFVTFEEISHAEIALDTMNFDILDGNPIRIMWAESDPSKRISGIGNIFIKNLDKDVSNNVIFDEFSQFGNILSCKIARDEKGNSKGYGFVNFETQQESNSAIEKGNSIILNGKKLSVERFIPLAERENKTGKFTNVYINNFGEELDDKKLYAMFSNFGKITSHKVMRYEDGKSKGFGFVAFEDSSAAESAVKKLNKTEVAGKKIYVGRAQQKNERSKELNKKYKNSNLYIKRLHESIDDDHLHRIFSPYGTIVSAKVMKENNRSRLFGFVCFSSSEEARQAITAMNDRCIMGLPLYVRLAQSKEERKKMIKQWASNSQATYWPHQYYSTSNIMPIVAHPLTYNSHQTGVPVLNGNLTDDNAHVNIMPFVAHPMTYNSYQTGVPFQNSNPTKDNTHVNVTTSQEYITQTACTVNPSFQYVVPLLNQTYNEHQTAVPVQNGNHIEDKVHVNVTTSQESGTHVTCNVVPSSHCAVPLLNDGNIVNPASAIQEAKPVQGIITRISDDLRCRNRDRG